MSTAHTLVIGVGTPLRHDDAAGWAVADAVAGTGAMHTVRASGEVAAIVDALTAADDVVIVDAMRSGARPGRVRCYDAGLAPLPTDLARSASTHGWGLPEAIELARAIGALPGRLTVVGIEGGDFSPGEGLSAPVSCAVGRVTAWLLART